MIEFLQQMLTWYNFIYTAPLLLAAVYLALHVLGAEFGSALGASLGDIAFGPDDDTQPRGAGWWLDFQRFLGVGKLPIMMLGGMLCLSWGILGNTVNYVLVQYNARYVWYLLPISIVFTSTSSFCLTKLFVELLLLVFPTAQEPATAVQDLVGGTAIVLSSHVDGNQGRARATDVHGNAITLFCRCQATEPIHKGDEVILVDYDAAIRIFEVEKLDVS